MHLDVFRSGSQGKTTGQISEHTDTGRGFIFCKGWKAISMRVGLTMFYIYHVTVHVNSRCKEHTCFDTYVITRKLEQILYDTPCKSDNLFYNKLSSFNWFMDLVFVHHGFCKQLLWGREGWRWYCLPSSITCIFWQGCGSPILTFF